MSALVWVEQDGGFRCRVSESVTLAVTPERYKGGKPAIGTKWHAQATRWCERTRTASRHGRDEYLNLQGSVESAKRLAEDIHANA